MQYTSEETTEILRRASSGDLPDHKVRDGLSLEEIKAIAIGMGLDPNEVARAAARYRTEDVEIERSNIVDFAFLRALPHPLTRLGWGFLVDAMRIATHSDGDYQTLEDGTHEWRGSTGSEDVVLTLRNEQRSLALRVIRRNKRQLGGFTGAFLGIMLLVLSLSTGRFDASVASMMGVVVLACGVVTAIFVGACALRAKQYSDALGEELVGVITTSQFTEG